MKVMRLRDQNKADLALTTLTLTVVTVTAGYEGVRWARKRFRRPHPPRLRAARPTPKQGH